MYVFCCVMLFGVVFWCRTFMIWFGPVCFACNASFRSSTQPSIPSLPFPLVFDSDFLFYMLKNEKKSKSVYFEICEDD